MARRTTLLLRLLVMPLVLLAGSLMISFASHAATGYSPYLRRYPYLTDVVDSYATINWATDRSNSTGGVRYGLVGSESCTAHYVPGIRTAVTVNTVAEWQWKAMLNLTPGAQYCYRVYLGSGPATELDLLGTDASPVFWTQVPSGSSQPYSFVVFGDWGGTDSTGANPYQANLMSLIANSGARFALTAGDNGYPSGSQANYGDLIQSGSAISAIFGPSFWKVPGPFTPIFPASGNHGLSNSDPNHPLILNFPQTKAVALSGGRYVKETYCCLDGTTSANYPSAWYAFDAGLARIYILDASWADSNIGIASSMYQVDHDYHWTTSSPEYQWLQVDLASHPSLVKLAVWHYPLYSDDPHQVSDTYLQGSGSLEGLLRQYGVLIGFAGHSHTYERNAPSSVGFPNYVTGGGGAPLPLGAVGPCTSLDLYSIGYTSKGYACKAPIPTVPDLVYHFLKVTVTGTSVTVTPINSLGSSFDVQSYTVQATGDITAPSVPGGLTASAAANGTEVDLSWGASTDNDAVRGYDIYRDGTLITQTDAATLAYADTGRRPAASYSYTVDAFDASGNHSGLSAAAPVTTPSTATYVFQPVADSYVAGDNTTVNYGTSAALKVNASPDYRSYLRFNVNETVGTITRATLSLYTTYTSTAGYLVSTVSSNTWDEATVTYANAPALGSLIGSSGPFSTGNWVSVDVTSLVTGNGVYDLGVSTTSTSSFSFNSRDATSNQPQLIIQTTATPGAPTATFTATSASAPLATPTATLLPPSPTPTPTLATASLLFTPSDDATINQGSATSNFGSATSLNLASQPVQDFLIKFTVSGTTGLPITSVKLRLYNIDSSNRGGDLHRVADNTWLQGTVTWSTAPAFDATVLASYGSVSANTWSELDVTPFITGDGTYSFMIVQAAKNSAGYSSQEGIAPPQLVVNYVVIPTATPTLAPVATNTPAPAPLPTDTPTLAPVATDTPTPAPVATDTPTTVPVATDTPTSAPLPTNTPTVAPAPSATNTPGPAPVFSDGFESGMLSSWSSSGGLTVEASTVHGGMYAAEGNTVNGATYAKKTLPSTYSDGYARIYFDIVSQASQVNLIRYRTATGTSIGYVFVSSTGKLSLYSDTTLTTTTSSTVVGAGWHALEFHASISGGFIEVWLDGVKVSGLSLTTNLGATPIGVFQIGEVQSSRTYDVIFDDVVFNTQRVGP